MKIIQSTLCTLLATLSIGCTRGSITNLNNVPASDVKSDINIVQESDAVQKIVGRPLSVSWSNNNGCSIATVIVVEGKKVLAYYSSSSNHYVLINQAAALIQSEINDDEYFSLNDSDETDMIELTGKYFKEKFLIQSIIVNGYEINFEK